MNQSYMPHPMIACLGVYVLLALGPAPAVATADAAEAEGGKTAVGYLVQAGWELLDPALFLINTAWQLPQFLRPLRAVGTLVLAPFKILFPPSFVLDVAQVPADLAAPFVALFKIVTDTPRLLSPIKAVGSLAMAAWKGIGGLLP